MNRQNMRDADRQKLIELAAEIEPAKNESIAKEALGLAHYYLEKSENQAKYIKQLERVNAERRQRLYEAKYGWSEGEDAEPVRMRGRWIPTHERTLLSHPDSITYVCSECGHKIYTVYGFPSKTNYCPNCGAMMSEGEENDRIETV